MVEAASDAEDDSAYPRVELNGDKLTA
jgi:hypothetical protein